MTTTTVLSFNAQLSQQRVRSLFSADRLTLRPRLTPLPAVSPPSSLKNPAADVVVTTGGADEPDQEKPLAFPALQNVEVPSFSSAEMNYSSEQEALDKTEQRLDAALDELQRQRVRRAPGLHQLKQSTLDRYASLHRRYAQERRRLNTKWSEWSKEERRRQTQEFHELREKVARAEFQFYRELGVDTGTDSFEVTRYKTHLMQLVRLVDERLRDGDARTQQLATAYEQSDQVFDETLKRWREFRAETPEEIAAFAKENPLLARRDLPESTTTKRVEPLTDELYKTLSSIRVPTVSELASETVLGEHNFALQFNAFALIDSNPVARRFVQDMVRYFAVKEGLVEELNTLVQRTREQQQGIEKPIGVRRGLGAELNLKRMAQIIVVVLFSALLVFMPLAAVASSYVFPSSDTEFNSDALVRPSGSVQARQEALSAFDSSVSLFTDKLVETVGGEEALVGVLDSLERKRLDGNGAELTPNEQFLEARIQDTLDTTLQRKAFEIEASSLIVELIDETDEVERDAVVFENDLYTVVDSTQMQTFEIIRGISAQLAERTITRIEEREQRRLNEEERKLALTNLERRTRRLLREQRELWIDEIGVTPQEFLRAPERYANVPDRAAILEAYRVSEQITSIVTDGSQQLRDQLFSISDPNYAVIRGQIVTGLKALAQRGSVTPGEIEERRATLADATLRASALVITERGFRSATGLDARNPEFGFGLQRQLEASRRQQATLDDTIDQLRQMNVSDYRIDEITNLDEFDEPSADQSTLNGTRALEQLVGDEQSEAFFVLNTLRRIGDVFNFGNVDAQRPGIGDAAAQSSSVSYAFFESIARAALQASVAYFLLERGLHSLLYYTVGSATRSRGASGRNVAVRAFEASFHELRKPGFWLGMYALMLGSDFRLGEGSILSPVDLLVNARALLQGFVLPTVAWYLPARLFLNNSARSYSYLFGAKFSYDLSRDLLAAAVGNNDALPASLIRVGVGTAALAGPIVLGATGYTFHRFWSFLNRTTRTLTGRNLPRAPSLPEDVNLFFSTLVGEISSLYLVAYSLNGQFVPGGSGLSLSTNSLRWLSDVPRFIAEQARQNPLSALTFASLSIPYLALTAAALQSRFDGSGRSTRDKVRSANRRARSTDSDEETDGDNLYERALRGELDPDELFSATKETTRRVLRGRTITTTTTRVTRTRSID